MWPTLVVVVQVWDLKNVDQLYKQAVLQKICLQDHSGNYRQTQQQMGQIHQQGSHANQCLVSRNFPGTKFQDSAQVSEKDQKRHPVASIDLCARCQQQGCDCSEIWQPSQTNLATLEFRSSAATGY
jgi:hypothetical protein